MWVDKLIFALLGFLIGFLIGALHMAWVYCFKRKENERNFSNE